MLPLPVTSEELDETRPGMSSSARPAMAIVATQGELAMLDHLHYLLAAWGCSRTLNFLP